MPTGIPQNQTGKIYSLVDPRSGEVRYVGRTTQDPKKRLREHIYFSVVRCQVSHKSSWIRELDGLGLEPEILVLEENIEDQHLAAREKYWVTYYSETGNLTNLTSGGEGQIRFSEDGKKNLSNALKGRMFTEEHKRKLKESRSNGNWKMSDEARQALIQRNKSRKLSPEHKQSLTSSRRGAKNSAEHNAKISASKIGKPLSEEHKKTLSERAKTRKPREPISEEERKRRSEAAKLWWKKRKEGGSHDSTADRSI